MKKKRIEGEQAYWVLGKDISLPVYTSKDQAPKILLQEIIDYMPTSPLGVCLELYRCVTYKQQRSIVDKISSEFLPLWDNVESFHSRKIVTLHELLEPASRLLEADVAELLPCTSGGRMLEELGVPTKDWTSAWSNFFDTCKESMTISATPGSRRDQTIRFVSQWATKEQEETSLPVKYVPQLPDGTRINYTEQSFELDISISDDICKKQHMQGLLNSIEGWLDQNIRTPNTIVQVRPCSSGYSLSFTIFSTSLSPSEIIALGARISRVINMLAETQAQYLSMIAGILDVEQRDD